MAECVATWETDGPEWILCPHHCPVDIATGPGFTAVKLNSSNRGDRSLYKDNYFPFLTREEAILFLESSGSRFREYDFEVDLDDAVCGRGIHPWRY